MKKNLLQLKNISHNKEKEKNVQESPYLTFMKQQANGFKVLKASNNKFSKINESKTESQIQNLSKNAPSQNISQSNKEAHEKEIEKNTFQPKILKINLDFEKEDLKAATREKKSSGKKTTRDEGLISNFESSRKIETENSVINLNHRCQNHSKKKVTLNFFGIISFSRPNTLN